MRKKILLTIFLIFTVVYVGSFLPIIALYLQKNPQPYMNQSVIDGLQANEEELFGFVVYGDSHSGIPITDGANLKLIRQVNLEGRWKKLPIDFAIVLGDVTLRGSKWDYEVYNKLRSKVKWPVLTVPGNHDDDHACMNCYETNIGKREYGFADRNSYFIILDSSLGDMEGYQWIWLEGELKKSQQYKHRFIFAHKSPISSYYRHWFRPEVNPWSYRFMKLCEQYNVDIVFTGHEHFFKERTFGGVKYITSGGGGMPPDVSKQDGGYLHYVVVRVFGDYVDYEVRKVFPPVWRYFSITIWQDAFYAIRDSFFR